MYKEVFEGYDLDVAQPNTGVTVMSFYELLFIIAIILFIMVVVMLCAIILEMIRFPSAAVMPAVMFVLQFIL